MNRTWRLIKYGLLSCLGALLFSLALTPVGQAHWADLAVAEVNVGATTTQMTLTFPTGLVAVADSNGDGKLSGEEVRRNQGILQSFLSDRVYLSDALGKKATLGIRPLETTQLSPSLQITAGTHTTLILTYTWAQAVQGVTLHYNLFLPNVPTARCVATVFQAGKTQEVIFSPENRQFSLTKTSGWQSAISLPLAIVGAFVWGAMHALSPGHGKTLVGAYLAGSRATASHALFLGLTTTITHTAGVFALGLITLFASQTILPEQLYPWLNCFSGVMIIVIGLNLFFSRLQAVKAAKRSQAKLIPVDHASIDHSHDHPHAHDHHHPHPSHHPHSSHSHSHWPEDSQTGSVTWGSLLALGISGGLVPCPSALVVLLSAISLGQIGSGLLLVLAFSLGLAGVLTGLGLLLVYTKHLFERLPMQLKIPKILPALSALLVTLAGVGITVQALMQIPSPL